MMSVVAVSTIESFSHEFVIVVNNSGCLNTSAYYGVAEMLTKDTRQSRLIGCCSCSSS